MAEQCMSRGHVYNENLNTIFFIDRQQGQRGENTMYEVRKIPSKNTYDWLLETHYAKRIPQITDAYGLFYNMEMVGVITYGKPASPYLCSGICGKKFSSNVYELNRVCLINNKKNEASYFVSATLRMLVRPRIIVSYADTAMGHLGTVYKACNFIYTGATKPRTDVDTGNKHARHTEGLDYSKRKYRSSKHRYVYFVGNKREKKEFLSNFNYPVMDYPKGTSSRYEINTKPQTQMEIF